jgi:hypothetical protein
VREHLRVEGMTRQEANRGRGSAGHGHGTADIEAGVGPCEVSGKFR